MTNTNPQVEIEVTDPTPEELALLLPTLEIEPKEPTADKIQSIGTIDLQFAGFDAVIEKIIISKNRRVALGYVTSKVYMGWDAETGEVIHSDSERVSEFVAKDLFKVK